MTIHSVKSWSHLYDAINAGDKPYDLRKNDRNYQVGDILLLRKYDNINGKFTGWQMTRRISYITSNDTPCAVSSAVLPNDYCILGLSET